MTGRPLVAVVAGGAAVLALLTGCSPGTVPAPGTPTPVADLVASPAGSGSACSQARPCALAEALAHAPAGAVIRLTAGEYGDLVLGEGAVGADTVTIEAEDGATIGKLELDVPGTTWQGVRFTSAVYLDDGADRTRLRDVHVDGSGMFVHGDEVVIADSVIENGTSIDGIQVSGTRVTIEGNRVQDFGQGAGSDVHSDCVQLFDASDVVIRGNYFGRCDNAALIFSPGHDGIRDVVVEGNYLQGCVIKNDRCSRGTVLDLREATAHDIVVRNNTMLDGSVMVENLEGLVFDRNIVGYVSNCRMPMTNSIVVRWNEGVCDRPEALQGHGNRQGEVEVVDRAAGDLRIVSPEQARVAATGGEPASAGYGGAALAHDEAGAGG